MGWKPGPLACVSREIRVIGESRAITLGATLSTRRFVRGP